MTFSRFLLLSAGVVILCLVGFGAFKKYQYEKELAELRNELASKAETIEIHKGVYEKLAYETKDLQDLLDQKDVQLKSLAQELKKRNEELFSTNQLVLKWKKAYEALATATQTEEPPEVPGGPARARVDFTHDFGYIGVNGYTLTNPATAFVKVQQNRPLRLSLTISQDKDKRWHTYTTSSEENVGVDIALTAVNPWILKPKWYEKVHVDMGLASGTVMDASAALVSLGLGYRIGEFEVGPAVWFLLTDKVDRLYGANLSWRPFQRD